MYQVAVKWKLWGLDDFDSSSVDTKIRGYSTDETTLAAELYSQRVDGNGKFKGLSVEAIGSKYCPTRRDVYLEKKLGTKTKKQNRVWGQYAGRIVEQFSTGLITYFEAIGKQKYTTSFQELQLSAEAYANQFKEKASGQLDRLEKVATNNRETANYLIDHLSRNAQYELALLGLDAMYSQPRGYFRKFFRKMPYPNLLEDVRIILDSASLLISPKQHLGLSENTTPDFLIEGKKLAIGEIKTGPHIQAFHLITLAGYALAYESAYKRDIDIGMVYFYETHNRELNFAQSYVVFIDDYLRRQFLDSRNEVYSVLQKSDPPALADKDRYCKTCRLKDHCYP